jgi:DNA-3-methyladenine glycosylase I
MLRLKDLVVIGNNFMVERCEWCANEEMISYHDKEWGVAIHDDRKLFEFLTLEGAQAGLNWNTILKKRENYIRAFDSFDIVRVSKYNEKDFERLMKDSGIVRNRLKIKSTIDNANEILEIQKEFGSFDKYIWGFVGGKQIKNKFKKLGEVPSNTLVSDEMSKDLKRRGFRFVGTTICYAFMQAVGMVNDHVVSCFRHRELS